MAGLLILGRVFVKVIFAEMMFLDEVTVLTKCLRGILNLQKKVSIVEQILAFIGILDY